MTITSICGFVQINLDKLKYKKLCNINSTSNLLSNNANSNHGAKQQLQKSFTSSNFIKIIMHKIYFWRDMLIVGALRYVCLNFLKFTKYLVILFFFFKGFFR